MENVHQNIYNSRKWKQYKFTKQTGLIPGVKYDEANGANASGSLYRTGSESCLLDTELNLRCDPK